MQTNWEPPNESLNTISYDAPLSFSDPSSIWLRAQTRKGERKDFVKPEELPNPNLIGKWVIISGSNSGIGREAALQFAQWGANIILACRQPPPHEMHPAEVARECKARAVEHKHEKSEIEFWELDCASIASVEAFAKKWLDTERPLDILCNNAGLGGSPPGGKDGILRTKDGFEIVHQVNLLSHVLLTLKLLPSLAKAPLPRVVCTTSCFHFPGKFALNNFNAETGKGGGLGGVQFYMNNKLWFQTWLNELQRRMLLHDEYKHITINGVHPGYVNSGIWNLNGDSLWKQYLLKTLAYFRAIDSQQGSLAITHAATAPECGPDMKLQGVGDSEGKGGGRYFNRIWEDEAMPHTKDPDCRMRVWRKVNDELKLQETGLLDVLGLKA